MTTWAFWGYVAMGIGYVVITACLWYALCGKDEDDS